MAVVSFQAKDNGTGRPEGIYPWTCRLTGTILIEFVIVEVFNEGFLKLDTLTTYIILSRNIGSMVALKHGFNSEITTVLLKFDGILRAG